MDGSDKLFQEKFKALMQDIYVKGEEAESLNIREVLVEITNKLSLILKEPNDEYRPR
ncbi:hypothetical protein [Mesobacillus foraminis]|uniref:hypothetical protein n=1 Tax=Mesobacillus foraminis TaxID=279826 RepID=UPI0013CEFF45|nr:hypothetical protein [Mesobacillus foraminis]